MAQSVTPSSSPGSGLPSSGLDSLAASPSTNFVGDGEGLFGIDTKSIEDSVIRSQAAAEEVDLEDRIARLGLETKEEDGSSDEIFEDARENSSPNATNKDPTSGVAAMSEGWRRQLKHIFILSDAGKPIYSRHGDEDELSTLTALIQAHVAFVEDMDDHIRAIHCPDVSVVFLNKGPLILVAVSRGVETVTQLVVQLTYMYHQILSVLTLSQLTRIFEQRKNYDLRIMIRGCERLLDGLAAASDHDPSFILSAVRVLPLSPSIRDSISDAIAQRCKKVKNVVFAILMTDNRLVALVRKKEYFIHPADLHLVFNLVNCSESFKQAESWTPVCLPKFNSSGFMHAHVSYLSEQCNACLLMLTVERDVFFELSEAKHKIVNSLEKVGALTAINESLRSCRYLPEDLGCPDVRHFLYKSKTSAQFTGSVRHGLYAGEGAGKWRLHNLYLLAQGKVHSSGRNVKIVYHSGQYENVIGWATQAFELYAAFDPLTSKSKAMAALNKIVKWAKKEENSIFILSAPTFN